MESKPLFILVIDDESGFHDLFDFLLTPLGIAVHGAESAKEALEHIQEQDYDLVFLDMHMPKEKVNSILQQLREHRPSIRIVLMSSGQNAEQATRQARSNFGIDLFLQKPFGWEELMGLIERAVPRSTPDVAVPMAASAP
ncbi:MAG: response regulator [Elusimicrobia bacterium]|nr:response regulator [Elusimicrobiota bacterium]